MSTRRIYSATMTKDDCRDASEATCRAVARRRGVAYPIPHTSVVGKPPADLYTHPERYGTRHLTAPIETRTRGEYVLEVTPEMEALDAGTETVSGREVDVVRTGTDRSADIPETIDDEPTRTLTR